MIELKNENIEMDSIMEELKDEKTELTIALDVAKKAAEELKQLKVRRNFISSFQSEFRRTKKAERNNLHQTKCAWRKSL